MPALIHHATSTAPTSSRARSSSGIYWQRYGWVAPEETVSGLEDEYSLSAGMPRLLYVKAPAPEREARLTELLGRIQSDDTASYKPFHTPEELARLVSADLALLLSERFMSVTTASEDHPPSALNDHITTCRFS